MCAFLSKSICFQIFHFQKFIFQISNSHRYLRNAPRRVTPIKTLKEFKIKNNTSNDLDNDVDYNEIAKKIKENDLDIEETFLKGEDFETVIGEAAQLCDINTSEEKRHKSFIKKKIVARKFFNEGKETNLLTCAAKEQIRFLHQTDPENWTHEVLANSFPISVSGVKKLLKSNFVMTSAEKIKAHDEDVRQKWESLVSRKSSDQIAPYTQRLWESGKLQRENYNGNSKLPTYVTESQKAVPIVKKKTVGEYAAIVQKYVEYKTKKEDLEKNGSNLLLESKNSELSNEKHNYTKKQNYFIDGDNSFRSRNQQDDVELPIGQFKENLKSELAFRNSKSPVKKQYYQWIEQDSEIYDTNQKGKSFDCSGFVSTIPKYEKDELKIKRDKSSKQNSYYMYDDKLGYQHPVGKTIKGNIRIPNKLKKKNSVYLVEKCVYDEDGELLYKLPH